ncbi:MAG TPA: helix-turn-helix transcriptional regulator [Clostridiaceae bacterium]
MKGNDVVKRQELKIARVKADMSQAEVAERLGVTQSCYCQIENGKRNPRLKQIQILIKLLKIKIDIL